VNLVRTALPGNLSSCSASHDVLVCGGGGGGNMAAAVFICVCMHVCLLSCLPFAFGLSY
jgi:succinate dehydrogenase/fumarate reductase flavoprotein subunit